MKLRCTTDSIRIRIRKSELDQLTTTNRIEEQIHLGQDIVFTFALTIENIASVQAGLKNNTLSVALPQATAQQWITTNQVGIEVHNEVSPTHQLHILIEKDFPCLDRENEDKSDTFWELAEKPEQC